MRVLFYILLLFTPLLVIGNTDETLAKQIMAAETHEEKERVFLRKVIHLSQLNTRKCDSLLRDRHHYLSHFSEDGKMTLLISHFYNARLGGSKQIPNIAKYRLNATDKDLFKSLVKCFKKGFILSKEESKHIKQSLKTFDDPTRKSIAYAVLACSEDISRSEKIALFDSSIQYALESSIKILPSSIYNKITSFYKDLEDFEMAIQFQQKGISYANKAGLYASQINHLINIGDIHLDLGNIQKAKEFFFEAQELSLGKKLDNLSGQLYNHLGELYSIESNWPKSISFYQQSLMKFYNIKNNDGLALVHKNIGKAYFNKGDLVLAKKNYELSKQIFKKLNNAKKKGQLHYYIAELYLAGSQLSLAESNILKAINYWENKKYLIPLHKAYLLYAQIKDKQNQPHQANKYLNKYIKFSDSFHQSETERKVAELSSLFKSEQKERKIVEQEKELKEELSQRLLIQQKLENTKQQNQFIIIILVVSFVLFVLLFLVIRIKNKQEQLKKKQKETELQQTLLRTQMNPHFIFNAMSVIQSYIYDEDTSNSSKFLIYFSKLMRLILENSAKEMIGLDKEMEIINRYLVIQKMRFEHRFDFIIEDHVEQDRSNVLIPPMLVQPFIENAIEHGDLEKVENGLIRIYCKIVENLFIFTIEDNGIGRKAALQKRKATSSESHRSMAINLTENRISLLNEKYKREGYLLIEDLDKENETGTRVTIATPFNTNY